MCFLADEMWYEIYGWMFSLFHTERVFLRPIPDANQTYYKRITQINSVVILIANWDCV